MSFRKAIFWIHLIAGIISGVVIGIMSVTGAALAYEKEIIAWAERDAQRVEVPANADRLPVDELLARVRATHPEAQPSGIVVKADPAAAVAFSLGRAGAIYANPYTGEVKTPEPTAWRGFMSTMTQWHRYIAMSGDNRAMGKAITGASNAAFLVLGITGLYLWWPRTWSKRALSAILTMKFSLKGKARDFNWHNSIGFWCAIPIIVMTATALPISYQWAGALINKLNGPEASAAAGPGPASPAGGAAAVTVPTPPAGAQRLNYEVLLSQVRQQVPDWKQITLNLGGAPAGRGGPQAGGPAAPAGGDRSRPAVGRAPGQGQAQANSEPARPRGPQPVSFSVREANSWPRTATTTVLLDPFTGNVLRSEGYADMPLGRQVRSWTRFLHTGEALGPIGQAVAGLGCIGGAFLVYTGFALSWRRFFGKRTPAATRPPDRQAAEKTAADLIA